MSKLGLVILLAAICSVGLSAGNPKYIFLFIGDGMATPQRMVAEEFSRHAGCGDLALNQLPFHATTRTASADSLVTDSAAAATAIACGEKTDNGKLGVAPDNRPLRSVAELAHERGKKVGIISSVTLNHATPGGFYAHQESRSKYYEIGLQLVASNFDFFGGGGIAKFDQRQPDIFTLARQAGYQVVRGEAGLRQLRPDQKAIALADKDDAAMPYSIDLTPDDSRPTLARLTERAIELLDNPDGFFIMVEGGAIDWAGHANEAATSLREVLALDEAVKTALAFYRQHPEETLVVVTGDHETGGMSMGFAGTGCAMYMERLVHQKMSVDVFGKRVKDFCENHPQAALTDLYPLLNEAFGFKFSGDAKDPMLINERELKQLQQAFEQQKLPDAARVIINGKAGIGWTSASHTALPVLTTSIGCGAELFIGFIDNTDIALKLKSLL